MFFRHLNAEQVLQKNDARNIAYFYRYNMPRYVFKLQFIKLNVSEQIFNKDLDQIKSN